MIGQVSADDAAIINRFFRAVRTARHLGAAESERRLTAVEQRQLLKAEDERDALRPIVARINTRSFATQQAA